MASLGAFSVFTCDIKWWVAAALFPPGATLWCSWNLWLWHVGMSIPVKVQHLIFCSVLLILMLVIITIYYSWHYSNVYLVTELPILDGSASGQTKLNECLYNHSHLGGSGRMQGRQNWVCSSRAMDIFCNFERQYFIWPAIWVRLVWPSCWGLRSR